MKLLVVRGFSLAEATLKGRTTIDYKLPDHTTDATIRAMNIVYLGLGSNLLPASASSTNRGDGFDLQR
ncbi:MAG: hypothetical protein AAGB97_03480 [Dehalococcoidia bacterium]